jgi:hypothetical protein
MEDFDIQISMNGVENELNGNFIGESAKDLWGRKKVNPRDVGISKANTETLVKLNRSSFIGESEKDLWGRKKMNPRDIGISKANTQTLAKVSRFEGEPTDVVPEENKKSWTDTLNTLTNQFKDLTGYQTNEQAQAKRDKELAEKGTKYKVLGMNPFVAIAVSLVVIIGGSVAITKIKAG